jgi:hypothetical protein
MTSAEAAFAADTIMTETLRGAEHVPLGARVHQKILIGGLAEYASHDRETVDELRNGKLELADEDAPGSGDRKADAVYAGGER